MSTELWTLISLIIMMFLCFGGGYIMHRIIQLRRQVAFLIAHLEKLEKRANEQSLGTCL